MTVTKKAILGCAEKRATTSAEGYLNRYRNGWAASAAATKAFVDETVRRRGKPVAGKPAIPLADLPVPMPISRFLWPFVRLPPPSCNAFSELLSASLCAARQLLLPLAFCAPSSPFPPRHCRQCVECTSFCKLVCRASLCQAPAFSALLCTFLPLFSPTLQSLPATSPMHFFL